LALSSSVALSFCFAGCSERLSETLEERAAEGARGAQDSGGVRTETIPIGFRI